MIFKVVAERLLLSAALRSGNTGHEMFPCRQSSGSGSPVFLLLLFWKRLSSRQTPTRRPPPQKTLNNPPFTPERTPTVLLQKLYWDAGLFTANKVKINIGQDGGGVNWPSGGGGKQLPVGAQAVDMQGRGGGRAGAAVLGASGSEQSFLPAPPPGRSLLLYGASAQLSPGSRPSARPRFTRTVR